MSRGSANELACAAALIDLPGITPVRLARLLDGFGAEVAWAAVCAGTHPGDPDRRFRLAGRRIDPVEVARRYADAEVAVLLPDRVGYPAALVGDPGAPAVLCASGDPTVLHARPAVAVVGTGLDVPYPTQNRALWHRVAAKGAVLSETALGTVARPRVYPARNRIIAALSDVVVVVESHRGGGSLYTVEAAARRSIPVCAVPGSVHSRASSGTNELLVDGCTPVRDVDDVLTAVALARQGRGMHPAALVGVKSQHRVSPPVPADRVQRSVWEAVDDTPTPVETVLLRTDLSLAALSMAGEELVEAGLLTAGAGWWARA